MVKKIKDSVNARKDKNFSIIVRTDANLVEGLKKLLKELKHMNQLGQI